MAQIGAFIDTLTLGEVEEFEDNTLTPIGDVYDNGTIGKTTLWLYYIHKKRTTPDYKIADAKKVNPIEALEELKSYNPKVIPEA